MAVKEQKPKVVKRNEVRPQPKSERQLLIDERRRLLQRASEIKRELETAWA